MRKIKDDSILAMAKHQITNVIFESQMKYYESTKNKRVREHSPGRPGNYNSVKDIRTSIELVPIKIEVDWMSLFKIVKYFRFFPIPGMMSSVCVNIVVN